MVGVPGKYKGCETCRLRRVKCDNQRPFCKKCLDSGRECAGYERETVFIIGTVEDQGRCSSHPPRVVRSRKGKATQKGEDQENLVVVAREPLRPAWDDFLAVSCREGTYRLHIGCLFTNLQGVTRVPTEDDDDASAIKSVFISLPPYDPPDVKPGTIPNDFHLSAQCLLHLAVPDEKLRDRGPTEAESICLFLFEDNKAGSVSYQPTQGRASSAQTSAIERMGPDHFRAFPSHHFFARVYRPSVIMAALLNRTPTHLAEPNWLATPFEAHPKSPFDSLLDVIATIPSLLARADHVLADAGQNQQHTTLAHRLMAQDLLNDCLDAELELARWCTTLENSPSPFSPFVSSSGGQPLFWLAPKTTANQSPYAFPGSAPLAFRDRAAALALTYYWTALAVLYPTLWRLYFVAVIEPVVEVAGPGGHQQLHDYHLHQEQQHQYLYQSQHQFQIQHHHHQQELDLGVGLGMSGINPDLPMGAPGPIPTTPFELDMSVDMGMGASMTMTGMHMNDMGISEPLPALPTLPDPHGGLPLPLRPPHSPPLPLQAQLHSPNPPLQHALLPHPPPLPPPPPPPAAPLLPLPPRLQTVDPLRYAPARVRGLAAHVCRALDVLVVPPPPFGAPPGSASASVSVSVSASSSAPPSLSLSLSLSPSLPSPRPPAPPPNSFETRHVRPAAAGKEEGLSGAAAGAAAGSGPLFETAPATTSINTNPSGLGSGLGPGLGPGLGAGGFAQPDLLRYPLAVATRVFRDEILNDSSSDPGGGGSGGNSVVGGGSGAGKQDARLELAWCEGFRQRLAARGNEMRELVQQRRWVELASFF